MEKQLPKNWVEGYLYDLTESVKTGVKLYEGEKKYYSTGSIKEKGLSIEGIYSFEEKPSRANREVKVNDILQARMSFTDKALIINDEIKEGLFSTGFIQLRVYDGTIIPKYIFYYLKSDSFNTKKNELASGTTQVAINDLNAKKITLPLPPLSEQNRIVAKLDTLFAQLETIKASMDKIPVLLKEFRQQVLTQAVTGKLTEEWRKKKKLGKWENISSSKLFEFVTSGSRGWAQYYDQSGKQLFVRITNMNYGTSMLDLNKDKLQFLKLPDSSEGKRTLLKARDILISITADIGMISLIPENFPYEAYVNQHVCLARPVKTINEQFLVNYLMSEKGFGQLKDRKKGATKAGLNLSDIKDLNIEIPTIEEQQEIVSRVESLFAKADAIEQQYLSVKEKIDNLPQALLHKAFKGELTEQLESDGDARELLQQIQELKNSTVKPKKATSKKVKKYPENETVLGMVAEGNVEYKKATTKKQ
jgi:type I restriction enzyme, S subunit